jgi:ssDNA-binding replication factor A large subunit
MKVTDWVKQQDGEYTQEEIQRINKKWQQFENKTIKEDRR